VESKPFQLFTDSIRSPRTRQKYLIDFGYYCKWLNVKDYNKLVKQAPKKIEDQIIAYIKYMIKEERASYSNIHSRLYAILKFYLVNRVKLDRKYITQFKPEQTSRRTDVAYTHEQIEILLNSNAYYRDKMMVMLMCSAGLRIGALEKLTVGNLTKVRPEGYQGNYHIYKIEVYQGTKEHYYSFCTFECAAVIDQYLDFRVRSGEILTKQSPLFREQFDVKDKEAVKKPKFLSYRTFHTSLDRLLISSGLRVRAKKKAKIEHEQMAAHGFRKFCNTQMIKAGVEYNTKEFILGHKITRGLDNSYDRTPEHERLVEYMKAVELLTISPENRLRKQLAESEMTVNMKLAELRNENVQIKKQLDDIIAGIQDSTRLKASPGFRERIKKLSR
jgi:integrase